MNTDPAAYHRARDRLRDQVDAIGNCDPWIAVRKKDLRALLDGPPQRKRKSDPGTEGFHG